MEFAHYTDEPVSLAVALTNSFGWTSGSEELETADDLSRLLDEHTRLWRSDFPPPTEEDLPRVRQLRARLREVFDAPDAPAAARAINGILTDHGAVPSLSTHGEAPHLHFEAGDGSLADWLGVVTAMGLATVIADHGFQRLGICQADTCRDVYVDTSRNRSRVHCSDKCRVRENVAAHRQRRRADG
ncbi:MAG: CGNR zinc finger domain-containing protein [Actinomycetota bacterium]